MPIDFPTSPITGQSYTYLSKNWTWNGSQWAITISGGLGATGSTGANVTRIGGACMGFALTGSRWIRHPYGLGSRTLTTSGTQYLPIWIESPITCDRIAATTVTVTTSGTMYLGIYNDHATSPGRPGTLLLNAGAIGFTANNTTYSIIIDQTLQRGWYWLASYLTGGSSSWQGYGAYSADWWNNRVFGAPNSFGGRFCAIFFGGSTFGDNPTVDYAGYAGNAIFLRVT